MAVEPRAAAAEDEGMLLLVLLVLWATVLAVVVGLCHAAARGDEDQAQVLARAGARRRAALAPRGRALHAA